MAAASTYPRTISAFAAFEPKGAIVPWAFERRALRDNDVALDILFSGICHSDIHAIDKWGGEFPLVPGHEIVGRVTEIGPSVTRFAPGDMVLVGTIVDSCRVCSHCEQHLESYCKDYPTTTYDGIDRVDGSRTRGGYSAAYVADEHFVYALPDGLDPAGAAPLVCAEITTYSPLMHWQVGPGSTVAVVGIGGLGHLGVKSARAMGAHVVAITTSASKSASALALGAHEVVVSNDADQMAAQRYRFDFILDTVSTSHPLDPLLQSLKLDGTLCSLGIPDSFEFKPVTLTLGLLCLSCSGVGGTVETREMLDSCAEHKIVADVEVIPPEAINDAFARLLKGDVRYRFVIDMAAA